MKKLNLVLILLVMFGGTAFSQTAYNPFTQNIHFAPEPTVFGYECGSKQQVVFDMGMTTADDATQFQAQPLTISICIGGFVFDGNNPDSLVSGTYASNFTWTIDDFAPNCLIGVQNQTLKGTGPDPLFPDPLSSGEIAVKLKVPATAPIGTTLSVNVNLQVPSYMATFNSAPDDNESTQTQTYCPLRIAGTVIYDTSLNNNSIYGPGNTPFNNPNNTLLYANLTDANGNVIATTPIATNGTYEFLNIDANRSYSVVLSTTQGVVGSPAPSTQLPGTWVNSGETCCSAGPGTDGNANGVNDVAITNFSKYNVDFGLYIPNPTGPLPTVIKNFYAAEHNCTGILTWTTSSEINVAQIEIYRKENNGSFERIATMAPQGGSNTEHTYSYTDKMITSGANYQYQLKFVDIDTKFTLSAVNTITAKCGANGTDINLFPNPVGNELSILYVSDADNVSLEIDIVDVAGRKLISTTQDVTLGNNVIQINTSDFATGNYFLRYNVIESGNNGSIKFLKD